MSKNLDTSCNTSGKNPANVVAFMIPFSDAALMPAQRKFDRCASAAALYDQRMKDFDAWCGWPCYNGDLQGKEMRGTVHENSHMKSSGVIRQFQINCKPMPVKIYKSSFFSELPGPSGILSLVKQHTSPHELTTNFDVSLKIAHRTALNSPQTQECCGLSWPVTVVCV